MSDWGAGGDWNDNTANSWNDWWRVDFAGEHAIDQIDVFTHGAATEPTLTTLAGKYGITAFDVQVRHGSSWKTVASVVGNDRAWRRFSFDPIVANAARLLVKGGYRYSRLVEFEAWALPEGAPPDINLALKGTASASSEHRSGNYPASGAINGNRSISDWEAGGGWNDDTRDSWPDWLRIDLDKTYLVTQVDIFTHGYDAEPSLESTASTYGVRDFDVEIWSSGTWQLVASVKDNNKLWRRFTFAGIETNAVRVVGKDAYRHSRITEVEVRSN